MPRPARPSPKRRQQAEVVVRGLKALYPETACALIHRDPFELLVATILSAQCTDARVNIVTPALFARYPDAKNLAAADLGDVEALIHSTGFFRAKAKNLVAMASALVADHGGEVPEDLDALTRLPGVGRKTAHVVLGVAFKHPSGVVVDTHVKRLAYRLGLTRSDDPKVIEHELAALVPRDEWIDLSHRLIAHGRAVCLARRPRCEACDLNNICPRAGVAPLRKGAPKG
jgi:endonuclease-3